ncbi:uncharacterized protein LOC142571642 [Dermacentor variabilis]|uniref:uncharacterized protein LOC142571642 n=1 Tax=Dermacentor variabilis TaxID=34621 RepID=UPI003F5AFCDB
MVPRRWMTTLAALTTLMTSTPERTPPPQLGAALRFDDRPHPLRARTAKPLRGQPLGQLAALAPSAATMERRAALRWGARRLDLVTVAQVVLTAATVSALALGLSCYACHSQRAKRDSRRCRYAKVPDGTATPERRRTLRLSPIGPAARCGRDNWASISLVNLLNNYPARDVEAGLQANDDRGDEVCSRTSGTT